jgi:hypothetical protein
MLAIAGHPPQHPYLDPFMHTSMNDSTHINTNFAKIYENVIKITFDNYICPIFPSFSEHGINEISVNWNLNDSAHLCFFKMT